MDRIKKSQSYLYPKHSRRIKKQGIKDVKAGKLGDDLEVFAKCLGWSLYFSLSNFSAPLVLKILILMQYFIFFNFWSWFEKGERESPDKVVKITILIRHEKCNTNSDRKNRP
jgi:hypothetical protein